MSLGRKIAEKLQLMQRMEDQMNFSMRTADSGEKGYSIHEAEGPVSASVVVPDSDKYSFVVSGIELENRGFVARGSLAAVLKQQARVIEKAVNYLKEKLALVELDEQRGAAQLRSVLPHQRNGVVQYFELMLENGSKLTLKRYEKRKGETERRCVNFLLTEDIFPQLVDDLARVWRSSAE